MIPERFSLRWLLKFTAAAALALAWIATWLQRRSPEAFFWIAGVWGVPLAALVAYHADVPWRSRLRIFVCFAALWLAETAFWSLLLVVVSSNSFDDRIVSTGLVAISLWPAILGMRALGRLLLGPSGDVAN